LILGDYELEQRPCWAFGCLLYCLFLNRKLQNSVRKSAPMSGNYKWKVGYWVSIWEHWPTILNAWLSDENMLWICVQYHDLKLDKDPDSRLNAKICWENNMVWYYWLINNILSPVNPIWAPMFNHLWREVCFTMFTVEDATRCPHNQHCCPRAVDSRGAYYYVPRS
jgi:hypothetical protein